MIGESVSLGEVCEILDTLRKPITKKFRKQGQYPYYGATGIVDYVDNYIFDETLVLIGEDGAKWDKGDQTAFIVSGKYWVNNHAHVIRPLKNKLNQKFLVYYLNSIDLKPWVTGLTVPKLNQEKLKSIPIPLFTIEEQQRIVAKLDAAFAEIDKALTVAEVSAKKAEMLFQNYLTEVFKGGDDWEEKSIDEMTDKTKNVNPNKSPNIKFKYVDISSVSNKEFIITETQLLLGKDAPSRAKKNIITNDIILATVRPTLKRIAIVPKELDGQVASTGYVVLRTNKSNHFKFLFYFLLSNIFMKAMDSLQRGASYPAVTDMDVKLQRLKVPNYQEQIKIAKKLDDLILSVNSIIKAQNKKIKELDLLKQSILQQTITKKIIKAA